MNNETDQAGLSARAQAGADTRTVEDLLTRIAREGIYTSEKESSEVSWRVIFDGLRFLEQPPRGVSTGQRRKNHEEIDVFRFVCFGSERLRSAAGPAVSCAPVSVSIAAGVPPLLQSLLDAPPGHLHRLRRYRWINFQLKI
jgi:hypothetical protein